MARRWASLRAALGPATRRRVHSPSAATSSTVVSVTAVRGSTNASTPAWLRVHSRRYASSAECPPPRNRPNRFTPVERAGGGGFFPPAPNPTDTAPDGKVAVGGRKTG